MTGEDFPLELQRRIRSRGHSSAVDSASRCFPQEIAHHSQKDLASRQGTLKAPTATALVADSLRGSETKGTFPSQPQSNQSTRTVHIITA